MTKKGGHPSEETRRKMSEAHKDMCRSPEYRRRIGESVKRWCESHPEEARRSRTAKGWHISEETKKKISEANRGKHHSGKHHSGGTKKKMREAKGGRRPLAFAYLDEHPSATTDELAESLGAKKTTAAWYIREWRKARGIAPRRRIAVWRTTGRKLCSCCNIEKDVGEFYRNRSGLHSWCKACENANTRAYRAAHPGYWKSWNQPVGKPDVLPPGKKWCPRCHRVKGVEGFDRNRSNHDGLQTSCRECASEIHKQYVERPIVHEHRRIIDNIGDRRKRGTLSPEDAERLVAEETERYAAAKDYEKFVERHVRAFEEETGKKLRHNRRAPGAGRYGITGRTARFVGIDKDLLVAAADWYVEHVGPFKGKYTWPAIAKISRYVLDNGLSFEDIEAEEHSRGWGALVGAVLVPPALSITRSGGGHVYVLAAESMKSEAYRQGYRLTSQAARGRPSPNKGKLMSEETKKKVSGGNKAAWLRRRTARMVLETTGGRP